MPEEPGAGQQQGQADQDTVGFLRQVGHRRRNQGPDAERTNAQEAQPLVIGGGLHGVDVIQELADAPFRVPLGDGEQHVGQFLEDHADVGIGVLASFDRAKSPDHLCGVGLEGVTLSRAFWPGVVCASGSPGIPDDVFGTANRHSRRVQRGALAPCAPGASAVGGGEQ